MTKHVDNLIPEDFYEFPVWQYTNSDSRGELAMKPVKRLPVETTTGKIIGLKAEFSNGTTLDSFIGNYSESNHRMNEHFVTASFWIEGSWFHLSRYHDRDYDQCGPIQLVKLLGLAYEAIFPIRYDLGGLVKSNQVAFEYTEPSERLSRGEIIAMALQ